MLRARPWVTAAAAVTLALGIGVNVTTFSFVNALLLRPLPVSEPDRLVTVFTSYRDDPYRGTSYPDYRDLGEATDSFSGLAAYFIFPMSLRGTAAAEVVMGQLVTANYFSVVGVQPVLGRTFAAEEAQTPGDAPVAMLSYRFWQTRLGGSEDVVGQTVHLNDHPFQVIGVTPRGFTSLTAIVAPDVWLPITMLRQALPYPISLEDRYDSWLSMVGRLTEGVSLAEAQARVSVVASNLAERYSQPDTPRKDFRLVEAQRTRVGLRGTTDQMSRLAVMLVALVGLVLLIACFNVANLQLARGTARQKEIALRVSLGAPRLRVLRQLLTENLLLALLGGALGLLVGVWLADLLMGSTSAQTDYHIEMNLAVDWRTLGFTSLLSFVSVLLFGFAPALQMLRRDQVAALRQETPSLSRSRGKGRLQGALVVAQVALSLVLLVTTGLFVRSTRNTLSIDPGMDADNLIQAPINLGFGKYDDAEAAAFYRRVVERVEALPGVESAVLASDVPLGSLHMSTHVEVDGYQPAKDERMSVRWNVVGPRYAETIGTEIVEGRGIERRDTADSQPIAVVNQTMARRYWADPNPVGRRIRIQDQDRVVIGIARDGKYDTLDEDPQPYCYVPMTQVDPIKRFSLLVRTAGQPESHLAALSESIRTLDPNLPAPRIGTVKDSLEAAIGDTGGP
ncbi:MAG: FtsX-like permease family protein, partial [bacterium]|nr:FtsX-like permease family protein [bacterium]